jgi:hypothetical protein
MARVLQPGSHLEVFVKLSTQPLGVWMFAVLVASAAVPAAAQTAQTAPIDLSVGYEMQRIPGQTYPLGANVAMSGAMSRIWRLVGEVGMSRDVQKDRPLTGTLKLSHYGAGPRFTTTAGGVSPYVQVLAGGVHTRADLVNAGGVPFAASDNAFMLQPGAGVLVPITRVVGAVAQADYRRVFFKQGGDNEGRFFAGVLIGFR